MIMNNNALIIIAKYPEKGKVKTRLAGTIPDDQILRLYTDLLNTTIKKLGSVPETDTHIAHAPHNAGDYFTRFRLNLIPLHERDLGKNMFEAFDFVFKRGYQKVALVGADIPDLSANIILNAFEVLNNHDLVYGPASDGGYYLVGMRKLIKEVFEDIPWSSEKTLSKSLSRTRDLDLTAGFTETLSDIDTVEDLKKAGIYSKLNKHS